MGPIYRKIGKWHLFCHSKQYNSFISPLVFKISIEKEKDYAKAKNEIKGKISDKY